MVWQGGNGVDDLLREQMDLDIIRLVGFGLFYFGKLGGLFLFWYVSFLLFDCLALLDLVGWVGLAS